ncbi:Gfo/Idh/MocA family oxidoreductase [Candidatus Woesearchaeota archaeon]|nr:Gfo/Idh/MocA family oxidoreductase [Candidatus Woesearchaeota archaeon]
MGKKYRKVAVLGAGRIGKRHCEIYGELSRDYGIEEIIFSRRTRKKVALTKAALEEYFKERNIGVVVRGFTEIDDVLEQKPDAISICTPTDFHAAHLETVLGRCEKTIVYCEKPLCRPDQLSYAMDLVELARERLCVGLQLFHCYSLIKRYIKDSENNGIDIVWSSVPSKRENTVKELIVDLAPHVVCFVQESIGEDGFELKRINRSKKEPEVYFENNGIRIELSYKRNRKEVVRYIKVKNKDNEVKISYGGYNTEKGWKSCLFVERKEQEGVVKYCFLLDDLLKIAIEKFLSRKGFVNGRKGLRNVELVGKLCSLL